MNWDEPLAFALSLANQVGKQLVARRHQVTAEIKYDGSLVTEADIEALRAHGYSDEDISDIINTAAIYNFNNRVANASGYIPDRTNHTNFR